MRVRRRQPCQIEIDDRLTPDIGALLRGTMRLDAEVQCHLLCPVTGERIALSRDELALVATLDAREWVDVDVLAARGPLDATAIAALAARGGLLSDADTPEADTLRKGEDDLYAVGWHPQAAIFHAMTRWSGVEGDEARRDHSQQAHEHRLNQLVANRGTLPPPHFPETKNALRYQPLPPEQLDDQFGQILRSRLTVRHFDTSRSLDPHDLARVLYGTFGPLGMREFVPGVTAVRRSSPSGGGLHPIEAYPLIIDVAGLEPGFYHYESERNRLALLKPLTQASARSMAEKITIGQTYFSQAHALVFHIATVQRNHWKYRRHAKAYKVMLLDSGHLSQTFYLLAAERSLGAFYTAAINDADLLELLELSPAHAMPVGANGLGVRDSKDDLHFRPFPLQLRSQPGPEN